MSPDARRHGQGPEILTYEACRHRARDTVKFVALGYPIRSQAPLIPNKCFNEIDGIKVNCFNNNFDKVIGLEGTL